MRYFIKNKITGKYLWKVSNIPNWIETYHDGKFFTSRTEAKNKILELERAGFNNLEIITKTNFKN